MSKVLFALIIFPLVLISGCASVQLAPPPEDAKAKEFKPSPGRANLYIYRNEMYGAAVSMDVLVNGKMIGSTSAKTYFLIDVPPGKHNIISKAENDAALTVEATPNKSYFIWQEVKMGLLYARTMLLLVNEEKGKAGVLESALIHTPVKF
jgi:hypothetical protein